MAKLSGKEFNPVVLRVAQVVKTDLSRGTVTIQYYDRAPGRDDQDNIPIPFPFASRGWGILSGVEPGTWVVVGFSYFDKPFIVCTIPPGTFFKSSLDDVPEARFDQHTFKKIKTGDIVLQSQAKATITADCKGSIELQTTQGHRYCLDDDTGVALQDSSQYYAFTEAGTHVSGLIMRDLRKDDEKFVSEETLINRLKDPSYDRVLDIIGRNPNLLGMHLDTGTLKRNPGFVEVRNTVNEFGSSYNTDNEQIIEGRTYQPSDTEDKRFIRGNTLFVQDNTLIESIYGTVVDVDGQLLDINLQPIDIKKETTTEEIKKILHKSNMFHIGFNSRKLEVQVRDPLKNSKWSIDVDKEGLTKINIPATSSIGNIPRFVNIDYSDKDKNTGEDTEKRQVDSSAVELDGGFLYHNVINAGLRSFYAGSDDFDKLPIDTILDANKLELSTEVEPFAIGNIQDEEYDPAGISAHIKLDGRLGFSVGRSEQDQTSIVFDASGKTVYHIGTDAYGRSNILDYDGSLRAHIGTASALMPVIEPSEKLSSLAPDIIGSAITELSGPDNSARIVLDGTCEIYLGIDKTDQKSLVLSTDGVSILSLGGNSTNESLILHSEGALNFQLGASVSGHSFGMQTEGAVIWNIGGGSSSLDGEENLNPGKLDIRVAGGIPGGTADTGAQRFVMDTSGITLSADNNITLDTRGSKGAGQILAVAQKEVYIEALGAGVTIKAAGISSEKAGIVIDSFSGILLRAGPQYIHLLPHAILISSLPVIAPPTNADTAPPAPEITQDIER